MMKFNNLVNTFSVFGNFMIFDEDIQPLIYKAYSDCDINIKHEDNKNNPSGKVMILNDKKRNINITLRPNRIDVQAPNIIQGKEEMLIQQVNDIFKSLEIFLEHPDVIRVALVQNFFVFDDNRENLSTLVKSMPFIDNSLAATEIAFRTNTPSMIGSELINIVTNINPALISENGGQNRNSLMVVYDVNTSHQNTEPRFLLNDLQDTFVSMHKIIVDKLAILENIF